MSSMLRSFISSLIMGICIYFLAFKVFGSILVQKPLNLAFGIVIIVCAGLAIYFISAYILRSKELSSLTELLSISKKNE